MIRLSSKITPFYKNVMPLASALVVIGIGFLFYFMPELADEGEQYAHWILWAFGIGEGVFLYGYTRRFADLVEIDQEYIYITHNGEQDQITFDKIGRFKPKVQKSKGIQIWYEAPTGEQKKLIFLPSMEFLKAFVKKDHELHEIVQKLKAAEHSRKP